MRAADPRFRQMGYGTIATSENFATRWAMGIGTNEILNNWCDLMLDATVLEHRLARGEMLRAVRAFERQRRWNGLLFLNDRGKCTRLVSHQP